MKAQCTCTQCGKDFSPKYYLKEQRFCGRECWRASLFKTVSATCQCCKKVFERARSAMKQTSKYCSLACKANAQSTKIELSCASCGSVFKKKAWRVAAHTRHYCSDRCRKAGSKVDWLERNAGRPATLYLIKLFDAEEVFYKVGITSTTVKQRYIDKKSRGGLLNYEYEILATHASTPSRVYDWEKSILETFPHLSYTPHRKFGGYTECFSDANPILAIFPL